MVQEKKLYKKTIKENLISLIFFFPILNFFLARLLTAFGFDTFTKVVYVFIFLSSAIAYIISVRENPIISFFIISIFMILYLVAYLMNHKILDVFLYPNFYESNLVKFWGLAIPLFLLGLTSLNLDYLLKSFSRYAFFASILFVVVNIVELFVIKSNLIHYMTISYFGLISVIFTYHNGVVKKQKLYLLIALVSSVFIVFGGTRGALLTLFAFYFLHFFIFSFGKMANASKIMLLIFGAFIIVAFLNIDNVFSYLNSVLLKLGYKSRITNFLMSGDFFESQGRNEIYLKLIENLNLLGYGIYGDWLFIGVYAHNWILELLIQFGIVLGLILIFSLFFLVLKSIFFAAKTKNKTYALFLIYFISILFTKFLLSASYLSSQEFWLLLGIILMPKGLLSDDNSNVTNARN